MALVLVALIIVVAAAAMRLAVFLIPESSQMRGLAQVITAIVALGLCVAAIICGAVFGTL